MSTVACVKVNQHSNDPSVVFRAVKRAMELVGWERYVRGKNLVLKVNVVWDKIYPSCTTTPMVIEGVLRVIKASRRVRPEKITIVDTDTAAIMRADVSFRIQGIEKMARRYGARVVNLSHTEFQTVPFPKALVLHRLKISNVLLEADAIITLPVLKTHSYSTMTGALKNQWGCIHDLRHNFHMVLHQAIADVNNFFKDKITFALMDGLFGMEGKGPKTGTPRKVGYLFASTDRVSLDTVACRVMGIDPLSVKHITYAQQLGVGSMKTKLIGDPLPAFQFQQANKSNFVMATEMGLRRLGPWMEWLMFDAHSPFLLVLRWAAKIYYDLWYAAIGIKYARRMLKTNYGKMWGARYLSQEVRTQLK